MTPSCPAASACSSSAAASSRDGRSTPGIRCAPTTRSSASSRADSGSSIRSAPSRCRQSKKNGRQQQLVGVGSEPARRLLERARPAVVAAARGSRRRAPRRRHGRPRTSSTSSGTRSVTSRSVRVHTRTTSPSRCTWMRAPSSLNSTLTSAPELGERGVQALGRARQHRPDRAADLGRHRLQRRGAAGEGEPGRLGEAARRGRTPGAPWPPGTSAAAATASSITPSSAPWRSSPVSSRCRNCCSSAVAAPNRASSCAARRAVEPAPEVAASASSRASTSATSRRRRSRRRHAEAGQRAPARTEPALPRLARQPGGGRLDLVGRRGAQQRGQRGGLRRAGAGGPDGGGAGDDLGEQHAGIEAAPTDSSALSPTARAYPAPCRGGPPCARPRAAGRAG